jgi:hypothetical protein
MSSVYFYILILINHVLSFNYFDSNTKYLTYDHNKKDNVPMYLSEYLYTSDYADGVFSRKLEKDKLKKFSEDLEKKYNITKFNNVVRSYSTDKNL